jgi:hypothetical protein
MSLHRRRTCLWILAVPALLAAAGAHAAAAGTVDGGGPNLVHLVNDTAQRMDIAFFRNLSTGANFGDPDAVFTLKAHKTMDVSVPDDWAGRAQKFSGSTQDPSNWAEMNFEKSTGRIWFDESDILGRNASLTMVTPDGVTGGIAKRVVPGAPADVVTTDSTGAKVIKPAQWFDGTTNQAVVDYLDATLGPTNVYVLPDDNGAVRTSITTRITLTFGKP